MRAFVALVPPPEIVQDLADFLEPRRQTPVPPGGPRWTRDEHLHLTLAFLPDLAHTDVYEVADAVGAAAARHACEPLQIVGAGAFPGVGAARVLWQGIEPQEDVLRLARSVRTAAGRAGTTVGGTAVRPHVTVARLNRAQDATRYLRVLQEYIGPFWSPQDVSLIASHLGQGPRKTPRYEVLETFALAPVTPPATP